VELVDLFPTLSELAGLALPAHLDGRSFAPVLANPNLPAREAAFSEFSRAGGRGLSLRTDRYRYTEWRNTKSGAVLARELYDFSESPVETVNLAENSEQSKIVRKLSDALEKRLSH
ncbi:MAG: sulfatase/phosphatase domain-containing protein, partial [Verrucomicrobiota bacterium]